MTARSNSPLVDPKLAALIIDSASDYAILTLLPDGEITSWSPGAEGVMGYAASEAIGMNFGALFTPPDLAARADKAELEMALREGRAEDRRWHVRQDGEWFWANGVTMAFEREGAAALLKIVRDETPAKLAVEHRILLLNELNHRIKNTLATVQSITEQTLRAGGRRSSHPRDPDRSVDGAVERP